MCNGPRACVVVWRLLASLTPHRIVITSITAPPVLSRAILFIGTRLDIRRGGSRNSLRGGGGGSGPEFFEGGFRVQVRGNFHILTSKKKKKTSEGGV